jgi:hypothetical protein
MTSSSQSNIGWRRCNTGMDLNVTRTACKNRSLYVHDDETGLALGDVLKFEFGANNTKDKWPVFFREQLRTSPLYEYVRLGTHSAVDGNIQAERTVDLWQRDKPLRLALRGFTEIDNKITWVCALHDVIGAEATLVQMMDAFIQPPEGGVGKRRVTLTVRDKRTQQTVDRWECELDYSKAQGNPSARVQALSNSLAARPVPYLTRSLGLDTCSDDKTTWTIMLPLALQLELLLTDQQTTDKPETNTGKPETSLSRGSVEPYYSKGDTLEIDGKSCTWVKGGKSNFEIEIDGKLEHPSWLSINNITELGNMRLRAGIAFRSLLDAGWIKVGRSSQALRSSPDPFLVVFDASDNNLKIYYGYGRISPSTLGHYNLEAIETLADLPTHADNALIHRAIEEQESIRAGTLSYSFAYNTSFYYFVGNTSALPPGIVEDTAEEYENAFKRLMGDSYKANAWQYVADANGHIKIKPAAGHQPELPQNRGWRRCNTGLDLRNRNASTDCMLYVYDDETGLAVDARLKFTFGDNDTKDKWPAFFREQLLASPLADFVRLGTHTAVDGDIQAEGTVDLWQRDQPLRIALRGFTEVDNNIAWAYALHDATGAEATLAQMMDAFIPPPKGGVGKRRVELVVRDKRTRQIVYRKECELDYNTTPDNLSARVDVLATLPVAIYTRLGRLGSETRLGDKTNLTLMLPQALHFEITLALVEGVIATPIWNDWTGGDLDDDLLPDLTGFEPATLGAGAHVWQSAAYLLADRDLSMSEQVKAWVINEQDGRIVKEVAWTATATTKGNADWPGEFLKAVNDAPANTDGNKWLCAGYLTEGGALAIGATGSPTSEAFIALDAAGKVQVNRLWSFADGCRLFSNAPFKANQVIASRLPVAPPPAGESVCVQVRDRTTQYLYETHVFTPQRGTAATWAKALSEQINQHPAQIGMLRAGVLASDGVTVAPGDANNALWIPQHSNLSVELEALTWQLYRPVDTFTPVAGQVIQIQLYDRYSAGQLPGSPFQYTIKSTDTTAAKCLASLAKDLEESALGAYLRLGTAQASDGKPTAANGGVLWHMPLPVRVIVTGLPGLDGDAVKALETPEGQPLTLGKLYEDFKDGVTLTMTDRWSGNAITSWDFKPKASTEENADKRRAEWVKALGTLLASSVTMWGKQAPLTNAPTEKASDLADHCLWLPADAEWVMVASHSKTVGKEKTVSRPSLEQIISYKRDRLLWEEAKTYAYCTKWTVETNFTTRFGRLLNLGGEPLTDRDMEQIQPRVGMKEIDYISYDDFQFKAPSANIPAFVASRLASDDEFCMLNDVFQLRFTTLTRTRKACSHCLSGNESQLNLQFGMLDDNYKYVLDTLKLILANRNSVFPSDILLDTRTKEALLSDWFYDTLHALKALGVLTSADEKLLTRVEPYIVIKALKAMISKFSPLDYFLKKKNGKDKTLADLVFSNDDRLKLSEFFPEMEELNELRENREWASLSYEERFRLQKLYESVGPLAEDAAYPALRNEAVEITTSWRRDNPLTVLSKEASATLQALGTLRAEHEDILRSLLTGDRDDCVWTVHLQLTQAALQKGIRFTSYSSDLAPDLLRQYPLGLGSFKSDNGGIHLYIPEGVTLAPAKGLCSASFISRSGITQACSGPLTIERPFKGRTFIPQDSLCADYAGTLGSELYDVSGASENGVDSKTGLFHAHYPVGVIRGLSGQGPELDLTLHYSATRANESGLGDGWAFRFSAYDNRLHRLTLHNGQTITLSSAQVEKAKGTKRLAINGVTLTGAKGTHGELTGLTVIFPSGRSETLAKPNPHDNKEPSENYKKAFINKVDALKGNLDQWLKESGITATQTTHLTNKIAELTKLKTEMNRKAYLLVPSRITSAQGGTLTLAWEGKEGHVHLKHIADGSTKLLEAVHTNPVAQGEYSYTFTVWPGDAEEYTVTLSIKDCLLTRLTRKGKNDTKPVQSVVFGYEGEPVLDRVLCSVAEEDGSLEVVSYGPMWKGWDWRTDNIIPLPRVLRHTLLPGAGQQPITSIWEWQGSSSLGLSEGATFSSTCSLSTGNQLDGPSTTRTWTLKNGFIVETQVIEAIPGVARKTTTMVYPDAVASTDPAVKFRLATQPIRTTVTTEDLNVSAQPAAPVNSTAENALEENRS